MFSKCIEVISPLKIGWTTALKLLEPIEEMSTLPITSTEISG